MSIYLNNPWKPIRPAIFKDDAICDQVFKGGYHITNLSSTLIEQLNALFNSTHQIKDDRGGLFYSVYSQNTAYRKRIHSEIGKILKPFLDDHFKDYRVILNSFVVKPSGPKSEFYLHQDTTGLDETRFSALNLWIPLDDVDEKNGALALVPKSHRFFSPFRSISFPAPFDNIQSTVRKYLKPIRMKKGEVLIFDNRVLHNSFSNLSGKTRVAVVCGLFPSEAKMMTCHKPAYEYGGKVELIEHGDDFLLTYPKFLIDCQDRPHVGKSIRFEEDPYFEISDEDFEKLCSLNDVPALNVVNSETKVDCNLIAEPDHQMMASDPPGKIGFFGKIKKLLNV